MLIASLSSTDLGTRMTAESRLKALDTAPVDTRDAAIDGLIALLRAAAAPMEARWRAAVILGDLLAYAAVPALLAALADESWEIRHSAVFALGHMRAQPGYGPLRDLVMKAFKDEQIPFVAGLGMMQIAPEEARAALEAAAAHSEPAVSSVAASVFAALAARAMLPRALPEWYTADSA